MSNCPYQSSPRLIAAVMIAMISACAPPYSQADVAQLSNGGRIDPASIAAARTEAADMCEARGLEPPSRSYSDCLFAVLNAKNSSMAVVAPAAPPIAVASPEISSTREAAGEAPSTTELSPHEVKLNRVGGVLTVPVLINGRLTLDFVVDSGASDVTIPADVAMTLIRTGTLSSADFGEKHVYNLANGSTMESQAIYIRSLAIGGKVLHNVEGSVSPVSGALLLGQSVFRRFGSWSIDNRRETLRLD